LGAESLVCSPINSSKDCNKGLVAGIGLEVFWAESFFVGGADRTGDEDARKWESAGAIGEF